jgi:DNA-directed RNA polymerase subunit RPC12/RpoP
MAVVLEAKCPECGKRAKVDDDMVGVKCEQCGFYALYEEYIEIMQGKAVNLADDFQMNWSGSRL